jgi:outer membrane protein assembly factor BamC
MTMTFRFARLLIAGFMVTAVSGCGYLFGDKGVFRDTSEDYKKALELPEITVPEGLDGDALHEIYPIPEVRENVVSAGEFEVPRPAPMVAGAADDVVRIQKLGDDSWALINEAPGQVWPQVRGFLSAAGVPVARVDASAGIMETSWLELQDAPMASRFRFRIEQGVQRGTSELHVLQMDQAGDIQDWPASSDNLDQEAEMLQAVAQYLANSADTTPVSMIAEQSISAGGKISMQESPEGYTYIRLALPYDRAWASLGKALETSSFEITDRDRSAGIYYARFLGTPDEDEGGWFDWLFGDEEHPLAGRTLLVSAEAQDAENVVIRLRAQDGAEPLAKRDEQALLAIIRGNIN